MKAGHTGLDQFDRIDDQDYVVDGTDGATSLDRFQYGYDADGNVLYQNNLEDSAYSELFQTSGGLNSDAYNALNELTNFSRGALSSTNSGNDGTFDTVASPSETESWTLDNVGNIVSNTVNTGSAVTTAYNQNDRNQLASVKV